MKRFSREVDVAIDGTENIQWDCIHCPSEGFIMCRTVYLSIAAAGGFQWAISALLVQVDIFEFGEE